MIKKHLVERVNVLRTSVIQTQKKMKAVLNEKSIAEDSVNQMKKSLQKKYVKAMESSKVVTGLRSDLHEVVQDL